MDLSRAIEINHTALTRIVAALIAMVGLGVDGAVARLPRPLYFAALRILRPAEAAVRRLIIMAARGVTVKPVSRRPSPTGLAISRAGGTRTSFQLFDTRKRFGAVRVRRARSRLGPRIYAFNADPLVPLYQRPQPGWPDFEAQEPKPDDGMVGAERLSRRLTAIRMALENLGAQAKRFKRWQARRNSMASPKFTSPLRPGFPPGHRRKPVHEVEEVLSECHALAFDALKEDTS